ncbi:dTDP-4-dehydrorhamnose 3,5-epimerase family protein [Rhodococcus globerulus]|uniref:dTDP-4-dehydrorhamnose 3,5-epimerase n=1 Tax=Rhodococcus globerulus TaxID=33008 RepID=A0ABU4BQR2_RHOGO|nr:dTDP-4-dehydrorhamnose 3,5-epimerase [Rhodococcus globerulus]MDV6266535.1 dTDP-4-dehydrorhamnose 3,5-epimerase [Rhodococcus globerulus]
MRYRELTVSGAWEVTPTLFGDERGVFLEWFKDAPFHEAVGHSVNLMQANCSVSAAGVLRGIHFADVPPGQAKYVTCVQGAVLDVVVDLRLGSPTFGEWDSVVLDDVDRRAVYLSEGLGHGFLSLEDGSTVVYLCSTGYAPGREHGIDPFDSDVSIEWPTRGRNGLELELSLSDKDSNAPSLREAERRGLLPSHSDVLRYVENLQVAPKGQR